MVEVSLEGVPSSAITTTATKLSIKFYFKAKEGPRECDVNESSLLVFCGAEFLHRSRSNNVKQDQMLLIQ